MRSMMPWAVTGMLAGLAAPAFAQARALPSATRVQYGVPERPCVKKPMLQPDGSLERPAYDGDCGRPTVEPPIAQPVPRPEPNPDPCRHGDCPRGRGWEERTLILREALRISAPAMSARSLDALFSGSRVDGPEAPPVRAGGCSGSANLGHFATDT